MTDRFDELARDMRIRAEHLTRMGCRDRDGKPLSSEQIRETLDAAALRDTWNEAIEAALDASTESFATSNAIQALKVEKP